LHKGSLDKSIPTDWCTYLFALLANTAMYSVKCYKVTFPIA